VVVAADIPAAGAASAAAAREENGNVKKSDFIRKLDHPAIEDSIARAERLTSGEIRVVIMHKAAVDAVAHAQEVFLRLGMDKTRQRNAVLFIVAPASQTFAVIGDEAVHQKCGDPFWQEIAIAMTAHFQRGDFTSGLRHGIDRAGHLLAEHFPHQPEDRNELPDKVIEE
jgi:uncharacterized membrane protein